jgi:hypothetical protein
VRLPNSRFPRALRLHVKLSIDNCQQASGDHTGLLDSEHPAAGPEEKKGELHEPFAIDLRRDRQIFNAGAQGDDRHRSA